MARTGAWLEDQVVYFSYRDDRQWQVLPAAGVPVTVYAGEDGIYVDGYAP